MMTKPQKQDYGWTEDTGWTQGDKARFEYDTETWKIVNQKPGRKRTRPIHESWNEVLKKFKPVPGKSQGAFCDWVELNHLAKLNRATFSAMQIKPIKPEIEKLINKWLYIGDGQGLDGSMNTNQDRL